LRIFPNNTISLIKYTSFQYIKKNIPHDWPFSKENIKVLKYIFLFLLFSFIKLNNDNLNLLLNFFQVLYAKNEIKGNIFLAIIKAKHNKQCKILYFGL